MGIGLPVAKFLDISPSPPAPLPAGEGREPANPFAWRNVKWPCDRMAVVDDRLRVHGIEELYVVDASIMPFVVSANLNGNCIMIGEKVSDMILAAR